MSTESTLERAMYEKAQALIPIAISRTVSEDTIKTVTDIINGRQGTKAQRAAIIRIVKQNTQALGLGYGTLNSILCNMSTGTPVPTTGIRLRVTRPTI